MTIKILTIMKTRVPILIKPLSTSHIIEILDTCIMTQLDYD